MVDVTEVVYGIRPTSDSKEFGILDVLNVLINGGFTSDDEFTYFSQTWEQEELRRSNPYWLGNGAFDLDHNPNSGDCLPGQTCDEGFAEKYTDNSGNQVLHFWFYAAVAYFDGTILSSAGNFVHDGSATNTGQWIQNNREIELFIENYTGGVVIKVGDGVSIEDYNLGVTGEVLGDQMKPQTYVCGPECLNFEPPIPPREVSEWIKEHVGEK